MNVVELCRDLIRIDTANTGGEDGANERPAAEYVAERLTDLGHIPELIESAPGRASVVARVPGRDTTRPPLLVHAHLDTVPADPAGWSVHPLSGEVADGFLWGRGAVDMKHMAAMTLAALDGLAPERDLVLAFVADEETNGTYGAGHLVTRRPDLFEGCAEALGEVGGFGQAVPGGSRIYPVQTGQKGVVWLRLTASGRGGHGSLLHDDNAVVRLATALAAVRAIPLPASVTPVVAEFTKTVAGLAGVDAAVDDVLAALGPLARMIEPGLRHTINPTMLTGADKENTVPPVATAVLDCRSLPGRAHEVIDLVKDAVAGLPGITVDVLDHDDGITGVPGGPLLTAIQEALAAHDPCGVAVPYLNPAATDAYWFDRLGIRSYGFTPLLAPDGFDLPAMFHGIDERVPTSGLEFGTRVLATLLGSA
ncbi:M20/M25/M40 family metallo-hydrolase [Nonomuraea sediminis]|uniref:M20/M25/M40 family metallo-hydrolase n=1 Tax=Nonomuraea sediminis TaxID=2835864 RepID=UPI0027E0AA2C|nr:M20/M25/M40 family metallo-hydrolase [Nonomuraea sediminis]